tara:strand:- start:9798 stop:10154 length:357 start_codon:yes stop_codon:yes gene_type:complete
LADPTCPCEDIDSPENCIRKHLTTDEALASETMSMYPPNSREYRMLKQFTGECRMYIEVEERAICAGISPPPARATVAWARAWAKKFEQVIIHMCDGSAGRQATLTEVAEPGNCPRYS